MCEYESLDGGRDRSDVGIDQVVGILGLLGRLSFLHLELVLIEPELEFVVPKTPDQDTSKPIITNHRRQCEQFLLGRQKLILGIPYVQGVPTNLALFLFQITFATALTFSRDLLHSTDTTNFLTKLKSS